MTLLFWVFEHIGDIGLKWKVTSRVSCDKLTVEIDHGSVVDTSEPGNSVYFTL